MLVEVTSLQETREKMVPILESQGYDYFWRPTWGDNIPPFYAWFIKRNTNGIRTHHIHMVENDFIEHWDRLLFRDFLIEHPETAKKYESLKLRFTNEFQYDRVTYTKSKTEFIQRITQMAKEKKSEVLGIINNILEIVENIWNFTKNMSYEDLERDKKTLYAVTRCLEVLGEVVKRIPKYIKEEYPEIPWQEIAGIRDKLIHEYFGVDT